MANIEIEKNICAIDETHTALDALRTHIAQTSENFNREVSALMESLSNAKEKIVSDSETNQKAQDEFATILETLTK